MKQVIKRKSAVPNKPANGMPSIEEYKGYPIFVIDTNSQYPAQFGLSKAKAILLLTGDPARMQCLKNFVESGGRSI